jgi:hypothetical protein
LIFSVFSVPLPYNKWNHAALFLQSKNTTLAPIVFRKLTIAQFSTFNSYIKNKYFLLYKKNDDDNMR